MPIKRRPKGPGGGQFVSGQPCEQVESDEALEVPPSQTTYAQLRDVLGCGYQPDNPTVCKCGAGTYRTVQQGVLAVGCQRHPSMWLADEGSPPHDAGPGGCDDPNT